MHIWMNLLVVVQMLAAIAMIGLVFVQHGKGADMGASFGSGASGSLFGATGSANFLSRSTAICATVFFLSTLGLAFMSNSVSADRGATKGSVLDAPVSTTPQIPATDGVPAPAAPAASK